MLLSIWDIYTLKKSSYVKFMLPKGFFGTQARLNIQIYFYQKNIRIWYKKIFLLYRKIFKYIQIFVTPWIRCFGVGYIYFIRNIWTGSSKVNPLHLCHCFLRNCKTLFHLDRNKLGFDEKSLPIVWIIFLE